MNKKGFSLTEILVSIGLLAIVGSIAVIGYGSYREQTYSSSLKRRIRLVQSAVMQCFALNNRQSKPYDHCDTLAELGLDNLPTKTIHGHLKTASMTTEQANKNKSNSATSFCYQAFKVTSDNTEKQKSKHCIQFSKDTGETIQTLNQGGNPTEVLSNQRAQCGWEGICKVEGIPGI